MRQADGKYESTPKLRAIVIYNMNISQSQANEKKCLIVTRPQRQSVESTYIHTKAIIYSSIEQTTMAVPFCHVKVLIITFGISLRARSSSELFKIA